MHRKEMQNNLQNKKKNYKANINSYFVYTIKLYVEESKNSIQEFSFSLLHPKSYHRPFSMTELPFLLLLFSLSLCVRVLHTKESNVVKVGRIFWRRCQPIQCIEEGIANKYRIVRRTCVTITSTVNICQPNLCIYQQLVFILKVLNQV